MSLVCDFQKSLYRAGDMEGDGWGLLGQRQVELFDLLLLPKLQLYEWSCIHKVLSQVPKYVKTLLASRVVEVVCSV